MMIFPWPYLCIFICGVLAAAALPDAGLGTFMWDLTPYSFLVYGATIGVLYIAVTDRARGRRDAFFYAYLWAFGYHLMGLNWVGNALLVDGNPYAWAYPLAVIGLPALLALFMGATFAILPMRAWQMFPTLTPILFIAVFWVAEGARAHLFTGFPWNSPSMFWAETLPVFQSLYIVGVPGLDALTIFWALAVFFCIRPHFGRAHRVFVGLAGVSLGLFLAYGTTRLETPPAPLDTPVVIVQPNIPQDQKWNPDHTTDHFYDHLMLSARPHDLPDRPALIVWPETALPPQFVESPRARAEIGKMLAAYPAHSVLLAGALRREGDAYYNSAVVFDAGGAIIASYDKHHLVPFGEYIPFQNYIPLGPVTQFTGLAAGPGPRTLTLPHLPKISPLICYESIFGHSAIDPTDPPDLLVTLTNDSWYGDTPGPRQHLAQARARAIEQNLYMIRAASTGISALIDPQGHIVAEIPYGTRGSIPLRSIINPE